MTSTNTTGQHAITDGSLGSLPTKILEHASGARAEILVRGAAVLSWTAPWRDGWAGYVDGYQDEADALQQHGGRSAILFPFANRLRDDRYTFDGTTHEMGLQFPVDKEVIHGHARGHDWTVVSEATDAADAVSITFAFEVRPGDVEGYPFALDVEARFDLTETSLDLTLTYRNVGATDAPVAAGWHPYFTLPGHDTIDGLSLRVPARAQVVTDDGLIPLPGDAAYQPLDGDLVHETLEGVQYDHAWDRLVPDADGVVRTLLTDPASGDGVAVWQKTGTLLVFTSDALVRQRESVAIESLETTTDAFNRPDRAAEIRVTPGQEKTFEMGVHVVRGTRS